MAHHENGSYLVNNYISVYSFWRDILFGAMLTCLAETEKKEAKATVKDAP
jgi:hypothetical protein